MTGEAAHSRFCPNVQEEMHMPAPQLSPQAKAFRAAALARVEQVKKAVTSDEFEIWRATGEASAAIKDWYWRLMHGETP